MHGFKWLAIGLVALSVASPNAPASAEAQCPSPGKDAADFSARIAECTSVIKSGGFKGIDLAALYNTRGLWHKRNGDSNKAFADFDEALRISPNNINVIINRASLSVDLGDFTKSIRILDRALADSLNEHGKAVVHEIRARAYEGMGKFDEAISDYNSVISIDPKNAFSYLHLGYLNLYGGSLDKAFADFKMAVALGSVPFYASVGDPTPPPSGWVDFCKNNPSECRSETIAPRDVVLSETAWRDLMKVNHWANETVKSKGGKDSALLKRGTLIGAGWPRGALLMTVVNDKTGETRFVLSVKTDRAEFVMNDQSDAILQWTTTADLLGYRYVERQSQNDPNMWLSLTGHRSERGRDAAPKP